jgi:FkbM family methyltransferase
LSTGKRILLAVIVGLALSGIFLHALDGMPMIHLKLIGRAPNCSWKRALFYGRDLQDYLALDRIVGAQLRCTGEDTAKGLERYESGGRPFWIKKQGDEMSGRALIQYLLTEHLWMADTNPEQSVHAGDVVVDCGAHVGTFTDQALRRGAAKIIAIEPETTNAFCLRRNFAVEIAEGRVVVVEKGVWSSEGFLDLTVSTQNSGMNSVVDPVRGSILRIPVTTIDKLVAGLGLSRVDFIKMDIEGAEREALRGCMETIRRWHPILMLEMYHRVDDAVILPELVFSAYSRYRRSCGPCTLDTGDLLKPHVVYFY